ncbi:MAG: TolC family outer membrane protein [Methylophilaceae bacterium]
MRKIYRGVLVAVLLLGTYTVNAETPVANIEVPATLKEIVERTVTTNPEVQANFHTYKAALQDREAAEGVFYPHADIVSNFRSQEDLTSNVGHTASPNSQTQLVLRQMLFDGFATRSEVSRLGHAARVRYYELQSSMQTAALDIVKAYIDVQRYRQLISYAENNYAVHKQLFDRIEQRVQAGVARRVDLEQASGRLALAEANLLTEMTNLQNVTARFQRLSGDLPPEGLPAVDFLKEGLSTDANKALELAYQQNPDLLSAIENIVASQKEISGKRSKYMPRLDLQARKNLDVSSNGRNSSLAADMVELTATFNLFNGFTDKARIEQANENLNRSFDLRDKACVDTRQTVVIAYNDVLSLTEQLNYRNQHQLSTEKAREAYRKQFDIGQRTLLDLLDTENEYFQARRTYTNTEQDLYAAYARTFASEGGLLSKLDVVRGDLPALHHASYNKEHAVCQAAAPEMVKIDKASLVANGQPSSAANTKMMADKEPEKIVLSDKVIPDVQFETNSARIKPVSYPVLDNAIKTLKEWGDADVEVAGHTDKRDTSSATYNQRLSKKRAQSVSNYLIKKGIDAKRLTVNGYGFDVPVAENDPIKGNSENRRVELIRQK